MEAAIVKVRYAGRVIRYIRPKIVINILNTFEESAFRKRNTWKERYFLTGFLFWTGLRATEIVLTLRRDIDFVSRLFYAPTIKKKGRVERWPIGLDHVPLDTLSEWEQYLSGKKPDDKIISIRSRFGVYRAVRDFFSFFGIEGVHPHMLRHSIAIYLASHGMPINALQAFLRHSNPANTAIYYSIIGEDTKPFLREIARRREMGLEVLI